MKKKILSLLLAAVCLGNVSLAAVFAEETADTETVYSLGEKELTVADVIAFSNMNRVLQWADFKDYNGEIINLENKLWETEWQFAVADGEDGLMLRLCGSRDKFPDHVYLSDSSKRQIDIRNDDVQSFLNKGAGEDSLTISEDIKEHFRIYETYSDESTKPERRLVQDFKSIMRYYNVPLRGAFTEFDNIDDVLASAYALKKYYVVEYEDGSVKSYNEHFQEMKSSSYTIRNGEQVALPYLTIPENAWNAFYNSDFAKTYIAPDAQVENVYWLSGESSMMGTAIYYRTSVGDYVYYYYHTIGETLFPVLDFCAYQQAIKDENAKYPESGGGINIADVWDLTDYRLKANISNTTGDVNNDGTFNISDVVLLQKWLLAVPDTHLANWKAADYCEDNKLDVFDLTLMKRALIYDSIAQSTTDLKTQFPEYYGLPTTKGLEVYLWQETEGSYKCGLLMGTNRNKTDEEIIDLTNNGATIEEMKEILSSYSINNDMIAIIPIRISEASYEIVDSDFESVRKLFWGDDADEPVSIAGKIFAYEKEGAGGYCTLSFNENGRFLYSPGKMSNYMGGGDWKIDGDIVSLIGMVDKTIYLKITDDTLVYIAKGSDEFPYMDIKDGEKFAIYRPEISSDKFRLNSRYSEYGLGNPKVELNLTASELPEFCYVENVRLYDEDDSLIGTMSPAMDADIWDYLVDCHVTEECSKTYYTLTKIRCGEKTYLDDVRSEITVNFKVAPAP